MCFGDGGAGAMRDEAARQRAEEEARQGRIRKGRKILTKRLLGLMTNSLQIEKSPILTMQHPSLTINLRMQ